MFGLSFTLTSVISNNATVALLAHIVIQLATDLQLIARSFLVAVSFAASFSFMMRRGHQISMFVYGLGKNKFSDFLKVGTALNMILWILATILIPLFWPP